MNRNSELQVAMLEFQIQQLQGENQVLRKTLDSLIESRRLKTVGELIREEEARLCKLYDQRGAT